MENFPPKLRSLLDDFEATPDFDERSELLIEFAERFQEVPAHIATHPFAESNKVPACESEAYVWAQRVNDSYDFYFAIDNPQGISAKAMAVILTETLSGVAPESIAVIPEDIVYTFFGQGISMGKGQGLMSMVGVVKALVKGNR